MPNRLGARRAPPLATLAVVFDFDETLVPDSTSLLLQQHGVEVKKFWTHDLKQLVEAGYDPTIAFLQLFLEQVGEGRPLGKLKNADLRAFGKTLDRSFYPGLSSLFGDLRKLAAAFRVEIEFYVISGGLQEVIEGTKLIQRNFTQVYGCQLGEDEKLGHLRRIKRCITFTEKTRYLFEINKGLTPEDTAKNPYLVNKDVPQPNRRIPFKNMVYVGDGLTDIPCFSLVQKEGGTAFGVFNPKDELSARRAFREFLSTKRVLNMCEPRYGPKQQLGSLLHAAVGARCAAIQVEAREATRTGA